MTKPIKCVVVDDEPLAIEVIVSYLDQFDHLELVESFQNPIKAFEYIRNNEVDVLFMDIQMPKLTGIDMLRSLTHRPQVIITTAYRDYALEGFELDVVDYLLKPIKKVELERSIQKFKDWANTEVFNYGKLAEILKKDKPSQRFLLKVGQRLKLVDTADAAYFFSEDKITFLVDWKGQRFALDQSLEKLEESLDADQFFRVNRQFIIHLKSIGEMIAYSKSRVKILLDPSTKSEVVVSTERSPHFKRWLTGER